MTRTYKTEFPDFDAPHECEALIESGWQDESWHNDVCPNFTYRGRAALFVDYVSPDLREIGAPDQPRFTVFGIGAEGYEGEGVHLATLPAAIAYARRTYGDDDAALARSFVAGLRTALSPQQFEDMRARNASPDFSWPVCASHDFVDANEVMAYAFRIIMGRDILPEGQESMADADMELWNAAWAIARRDYLTAPINGEAQ
jgi:hypothetical protein